MYFCCNIHQYTDIAQSVRIAHANCTSLFLQAIGEGHAEEEGEEEEEHGVDPKVWYALMVVICKLFCYFVNTSNTRPIRFVLGQGSSIELEGEGGGLLVFLGKRISVSNFDGNFFSVSDMDRQNILKALYALKILFLQKINNVAITCPKKKNPLRHEANKNMLTPKKNLAPPPPPPHPFIKVKWLFPYL